jgi:glucokinase
MAGEVGHIRLSENGPVGFGKSGSFKGFCSGAGIARLAQTKARERFQQAKSVSFCASESDLPGITAKEVAEAAAAGDALAIEVFAQCGRSLGQSLSVLIDILNPELIVLGSIFVRAQALIWPAAQAVLEREALQRSLRVCRVVPAGLGEQVGDYAALVVAAYEPARG